MNELFNKFVLILQIINSKMINLVERQYYIT